MEHCAEDAKIDQGKIAERVFGELGNRVEELTLKCSAPLVVRTG